MMTPILGDGLSARWRPGLHRTNTVRRPGGSSDPESEIFAGGRTAFQTSSPDEAAPTPTQGSARASGKAPAPLVSRTGGRLPDRSRHAPDLSRRRNPGGQIASTPARRAGADDMIRAAGDEDTSFVVPEDRRNHVVAVHRRAGDGLEKVPSSIRFPESYRPGESGWCTAGESRPTGASARSTGTARLSRPSFHSTYRTTSATVKRSATAPRRRSRSKSARSA